MSKKHKTVNNVLDCKDSLGRWITSYTITTDNEYIQHRTIAFNLWLGINNRCRAGGSQQKANSKYIGTQNLFVDFQEFAGWCHTQPGYDKLDSKGNRWQLDKDLFGSHYSPETCCFIPAALNTLLKSAPNKVSNLPVGVALDTTTYRAKPYSVRYFKYDVGYTGRERFVCAESAGKAWQANRLKSLSAACYSTQLPERVRAGLSALMLKTNEE